MTPSIHWRLPAVMLTLMLIAATLAWRLTPTHYLANTLTAVQLKTMVPSAFGDWHALTNQPNQIVDPTRQQMLEQIYTETLTRTYANSSGYRIMLSIAYGRDQRGNLQLHQPEVCYPAQGFTVLDKHKETLQLSQRSIAVTKLETQLGRRLEPVTYWTLVGESIYRGGIEKKLAEMAYGKSGLIADGMLIRVSSIDANVQNAYEQQSRFATDFIQALPPDLAKRFAGAQQL